MRPKCRHCRERLVNRSRGLCWACFYTPGVKELYPPTSVYANRGVGNENATSRPPAEPCLNPPGSEGRIETLTARAKRGEGLFHEGDARW